MDKTEMTKDELQAFMKLSTYLSDVVINDPVIDSDFAREIVENARILQDCIALGDDEKGKYRKVAEMFQRFC